MRTSCKKTLVRIFALFIIIVLAMQSIVINVNASEKTIEHYADILDEFNKEYQTNYAFLSLEKARENNTDIEHEYNKILSMTDDEFWSYIYNAHFNLNNDENIDNSPTYVQTFEKTDGLASTVSEQRQYYDGVSTRYVYIRAQIVNVEGYRYDSIVLMDSVHKSYPAREVTNYTYSITNSGKKVVITYKYKKLLSAMIEDLVSYTAKVTFTAGGGDVWYA